MRDAQLAWIETLSELRAASRPCALVTVTATKGSTPREPGARMIVTDGRLFWGTVGGGNLEHLAIDHANSLLARGEQCSESMEYPLSEKAGQCCGGQVTLFFETFPWSRRQVTVFGAGHVGQALGGLAGYLRAKVLLIDSRDEAHLEPPLSKPRDFEALFIDSPEEEVDTLPATSLLLIMTHSHALDLEILARALRRGTFAYVGLIGSERKWARFPAAWSSVVSRLSNSTVSCVPSGWGGHRRNPRPSPCPWPRNSWVYWPRARVKRATSRPAGPASPPAARTWPWFAAWAAESSAPWGSCPLGHAAWR